jgi:hypothetical protein
MMWFPARVAISAVALALAASCWMTLRADCPAPPPVCVALNGAELVFHGRVSTVEPVNANTNAPGWRVAFTVIRTFKGVEGKHFAGSFTAAGLEEFRFRPGLEVLVYASRYQGVWTTACSRTIGRDQSRGERSQAMNTELAQLASCAAKPAGR